MDLQQASNMHPNATWFAKLLQTVCPWVLCDLQSYSKIWKTNSQTQNQINYLQKDA